MTTRYLDPTNDAAFKRLFGTENHKPLLISFLNAITDEAGHQYIVEMQNRKIPDFLKRTQYPKSTYR